MTKKTTLKLTHMELSYLCEYLGTDPQAQQVSQGRYNKLLSICTTVILRKLAIQCAVKLAHQQVKYTITLKDGKAEALMSYFLATPVLYSITLHNAIVSQIDPKL